MLRIAEEALTFDDVLLLPRLLRGSIERCQPEEQADAGKFN